LPPEAAFLELNSYKATNPLNTNGLQRNVDQANAIFDVRPFHDNGLAPFSKRAVMYVIRKIRATGEARQRM